MKEVKSPKKPLIFYYGIALLVIVLFNVIVSPLLVKARVTEVDYGTFMSMIEQKKIGNVEVDDDQIIFTDKDDAKKIYKTGAMNDPTLTQRLYDSGAKFSKDIETTTYADCHPDAAAGFTAQTQTHRLQVECPPELWETVPAAERDGLRGVLDSSRDVLRINQPSPCLLPSAPLPMILGSFSILNMSPFISFCCISSFLRSSASIYMLRNL